MDSLSFPAHFYVEKKKKIPWRSNNHKYYGMPLFSLTMTILGLLMKANRLVSFGDGALSLLGTAPLVLPDPCTFRTWSMASMNIKRFVYKLKINNNNNGYKIKSGYIANALA